MESYESQVVSLLYELRTDKVNEAEEKLMALASSLEFLEVVFGVIRSPQQEQWVKTLAATFLNRVICERLEEMGSAAAFAALKSILESEQVSNTDKRCFERSIVSLIDAIGEPEQIEQWRQLIRSHIRRKELFDSGLLLISCVAVAEIHPDYLCVIAEETFEPTVEALAGEVSLENCVPVNELLKNWIVVFDKLRTVKRKESPEPARTLERICRSESLAKLIFEVYRLRAPEEVWVCVEPELHELNLLKYEAADLHRRVGEWVLKNRALPLGEEAPHSGFPLIDLLGLHSQKVSNSIAVVSSNWELLDKFECHDLVTALFGLANVYISYHGKRLGKEALEVWMHIACFSCLRATDSEVVIFEENPVEFNSLAEDLCDKQTFGVLKTEAARLLETIADVSKDCMRSGIHFAVECLKMRLGFVPMLQNSEIRVLEVETCFMVLAIFSYSLEHYPECLDALRVILCDKKTLELPPFEMSRVILLLAYNFGEIFPNRADGAVWVEFAFNYDRHPTTRFMALDFISNVADEFFSQEFVERLCVLIRSEKRECGQVWAITKKLLSTQKAKISEQMASELVKSVFYKIEEEVALLHSEQTSSAINVINALHVLRIFSEDDYLESRPQLAAHIASVARMYDQAVALNVEDEIISIMSEYVKRGIAFEGLQEVLPLVLKQFAKEEFHDRSYFVLFNEILVGSSDFESVREILKTLMSGLMFHLFDMSETARKTKMKVAIANTLILLQNALCVHGYQIGASYPDTLVEVASMCIRLFPEKDEKPYSKNLLAKALNLMFLCHLYQYSENTISYLARFVSENIFRDYDGFVLVKLLCRAAFMEESVELVIEYLDIMIDVCFECAERAKKNPQPKKGKAKITHHSDLDKILNKISCPFTGKMTIRIPGQVFPAKEELHACIKRMKGENFDTYKLLTMNMSEERKSKLSLLVNEVVEVEGKKRVIRKVVGAKSRPLEEDLMQEDSENAPSDEEEQISEFKRARVILKRKGQARGKPKPIDSE